MRLSAPGAKTDTSRGTRTLPLAGDAGQSRRCPGVWPRLTQQRQTASPSRRRRSIAERPDGASHGDPSRRGDLAAGERGAPPGLLAVMPARALATRESLIDKSIGDVGCEAGWGEIRFMVALVTRLPCSKR